MRRGISVACCLLLAGAAAFSQTNANAGEPQFEAATVKQVAPVSLDGPYVLGRYAGGPGTSDPGRVTYSRIGLRGLLTLAYGVQRYQVIGPDWLDGERYDVNATIRPGATKEEVSAMLRALLTEHFHVSLHHETRDLPVYELTVGKSGPKLKASAQGAGPLPVTPEPLRRDGNGVPMPRPGVPFMITTSQDGVVHLTARAQTLGGLANFLWNNQLGAPVIDKTGLMGAYDFDLNFALGPVPQDDAPNIFVAIEEQLGLRLEPKKGPVDVLVVDHADKVPEQN